MGNRTYDDPYGLFESSEVTELPAPTPKVEGSSNPISGLISGLGSGLAALPKQMIGDPLRALGILSTPTREELISRNQQEVAAQPTDEGYFTKTARQVGEMAPASLLPSAIGALIGGLLAGPAGAVAGAGIGGAGGALPFAGSAYQQTKENAIMQGVDPGNAPLLNALSEGLGEGISGAIPGAALGKFLTKPLASAGIGALLKSAAKPLIATTAGEVLPEMFQAGSQAAVEKAYGIRPEADPLQEMVDVIGPTLGLSALLGGGAIGAKKLMTPTRALPEGFGKEALSTDVTLQMPTEQPEAGVAATSQAAEGYDLPPLDTLNKGLTGVMPEQVSPDDYTPTATPGELAQLPHADEYQFDNVSKVFDQMKSGLSSMSQGQRQAVANSIDRYAPDLTAEDQARLAEVVTNGRWYEDRPPVNIMTGKPLETAALPKQKAPKEPTVAKPAPVAPVQPPVSSISIEGAPPVVNQPGVTGGLPPTVEAKAAMKRGKPLDGKAVATSTQTQEDVDKAYEAAMARIRAKESTPKATPTAAPVTPTVAETTPTPEPVTPTAPKKQTVSRKRPVPVSQKGEAAQSTAPETLDQKDGRFAYKNIKTGEVRQDLGGVMHDGLTRVGIDEKDAKNWKGGFTAGGRFMTAKEYGDYSNTKEEAAPPKTVEERASQKVSEGLGRTRNVSIQLDAKKNLGGAHPLIRTITKATDNMANGEDVGLHEVKPKDTSYQAVAGFFKRVAGSKDGGYADKRGNINTAVNPDEVSVAFGDSSARIVRRGTPGNYTYTVAVNTRKQAPAATETDIQKAKETVIKESGIETSDKSKEVVHSPAGEKMPVQDRNTRRTLLSELGDTPAFAGSNNMVHTPTTSYRIKKETGKPSVLVAVGENTPERWEELLRNNPPDSNTKKLSTNKAYRKEYVEKVGIKEKPAKAAPTKKAAAKPIPASKAETIKEEPKEPTPPATGLAAKKAALKKQIEESKSKPKKAEPVKPSKAEAPKETAKKEEPKKKEFTPDDIKFEGTTITTPRVEIKFPKAEDMEKGNISIHLDGVEKHNMPASDLSDPKKVAKLIGAVIHKAHGGDKQAITDRVHKEMTGGPVESKEAKGESGEAKAEQKEESKKAKVAFMITADAKQQLFDLGYTREDVAKMKPDKAQEILAAGTTKPKEEKVTRTKAKFIADRFGGYQPTLNEFVQTIPNEQMKSFASFLNRVREALDLSPSAFAEFRKTNDMQALYQQESSKKPRLVQKARMALMQKGRQFSEIVFHGGPRNLKEARILGLAEVFRKNKNEGTRAQSEGAGFYITEEPGVGELYAKYSKKDLEDVEDEIRNGDFQVFINGRRGGLFLDKYNVDTGNMEEEDYYNSLMGMVYESIDKAFRDTDMLMEHDSKTFAQEVRNNLDEQIAMLRKEMESGKNQAAEFYGDAAIKELEFVKQQQFEINEVEQTPAYLNRIDLPLKEMRFLEWEQTVPYDIYKKVVDRVGGKVVERGFDPETMKPIVTTPYFVHPTARISGRSFYFEIVDNFREQMKAIMPLGYNPSILQHRAKIMASKLLASLGVDGMKYRGRPPGGERFTADYFNYVIYDPKKWITPDKITRVGLYNKEDSLIEDLMRQAGFSEQYINAAQPEKVVADYYGKKLEYGNKLAKIMEDEWAGKVGVRFPHKLAVPNTEVGTWANILNRVFGVNVYFIETDKYTDTAAKYFSGFNSIVVNLNSKKFKGANGNKNLILHTLGHELSHAMETKEPAIWAELTNKLLADPTVAKAYEKFKPVAEKLGYDVTEIKSEFMADLMGRGLYDEKLWLRLTRDQDPLLQRALAYIKDKINQVLMNIGNWMSVVKENNVPIYGRMQYTEDIYNKLSEVSKGIENALYKYAKYASRNIDSAYLGQEYAGLAYNELTKSAPQSTRNWFKGSYFMKNGKPRYLYHGTVNTIKDGFITDRKNGSLDQRLGAQFALDPKLSNEFSLGKYTDFSMASNKENLIYDAATDKYHLPSGRVYRVFTNVKNPKDLRNSSLEDWQQVQQDAFNTLFKDGGRKQLFIDTYHNVLGYDVDMLNTEWSNMSKNNKWDEFFFAHDLPHFAEIDPANKKAMQAADNFTTEYKNALRKQGYDSIMYTHTDHNAELDDATAVIIFDSGAIKNIYDGEFTNKMDLDGDGVVYAERDFVMPQSPNPAADEEFERSRGLGTIGKWERFKDFLSSARVDFTRQFVHLDPNKYGDIGNTLYKFKYSGEYAQKIAIDKLRDVVRGLDKGRYGVFRRMVVMPDLINYMEKLEADPKFAGEKLMGFNSVQEANDFYQHYKRIAMRDPKIMDALAKRKAMMDHWRGMMVDAKILPEHVLDSSRSDYYRHQVLDWMGAKASGEEPSLLLGTQGESVRLRKAGWQRARKGSLHNYNTEYLQAEFEVLAQGIHQLEAKAALDHLKTYDMFEALRSEWKAQMDQPGGERDFKLFAKQRGYVPWQPRKGNFLERVYTITDKALERVMAEQRGETVDLETGERISTQNLNESMRGVKKQTVQGMPLPSWYLPQDVARQLDELEPPPDDSFLGKVTSKTLSAWKQWVLFNPLRLTKYVLNNTSGDLDIAIAYDPKILKYAKQAAIDLYKYTKDPGSMPDGLRAQLEHALKQRVIDSGMTIEEIGGIGRLTQSDIFKYLDDTHTELYKKFGKALPEYMKFVKKWANYRENILRLAAYRYFQEKVASGQSVYGASRKQEIDNITNADDKAAKLARELIGDYGNISKGGQWTRKHLIPFWSWLEINAPRYMRILRNSKYEPDINLLGRYGRLGVTKAVSLGSKAAALFMAVNMFNKIFWPEEDDELNKTGRQQLHLILGRREDGTIRTLRFQGALSDALSWVGLENMGTDLRDLVSGRKSVLRQLKEMGIAPVQKIALGMRPMERTMSEMALGKTMWPDITNPRPIRDKAEHFFKSISMDIPYRYAMHKPVRGVGEDSENMLFYRSDPGEAAYYKINQKAREFLSDKNVDLPEAVPSRRSNALYYYKQAKKYGDKDAEQYWLGKFKEEGGKMQNILQSINKMHPLATIPLQYRGQFFSILDPQERGVYDMAVNWWTKTYRR